MERRGKGRGRVVPNPCSDFELRHSFGFFLDVCSRFLFSRWCKSLGRVGVRGGVASGLREAPICFCQFFVCFLREAGGQGFWVLFQWDLERFFGGLGIPARVWLTFSLGKRGVLTSNRYEFRLTLFNKGPPADSVLSLSKGTRRGYCPRGGLE